MDEVDRPRDDIAALADRLLDHVPSFRVAEEIVSERRPIPFEIGDVADDPIGRELQTAETDEILCQDIGVTIEVALGKIRIEFDERGERARVVQAHVDGLGQGGGDRPQFGLNEGPLARSLLIQKDSIDEETSREYGEADQ